MTDPAHPDPSNRADSRPAGQDRDSAVDQFGVDAVQQPAEHIACREDQHDTDNARDDQTNDRIGRRKSQRRADGARDHRQRRQTVCARMHSVGPQCGRPDAGANPNAIKARPLRCRGTRRHRRPRPSPRCASGTGSTSRRTASTAATTAEIAIITTTNNPARSSTRPKPYVYRRVAARRLTEKAIHSGTAVNASEKLWMVSANNATEPDIATMTSCAAAG